MSRYESTIIRMSRKLQKQDEKMNVSSGYYWYKEQDTQKTIYVFGEKKFTDTLRYYYYDFSEKSVRSFCSDNGAFVERMKQVDDINTIKIYDLFLQKELEVIKNRYDTLIEMLRHSMQTF